MHHFVRASSIALSALLLAACGASNAVTPIVRCQGALTGALPRTFDVCNGFDQLYRQSLGTTLLSATYDELTRNPETRGTAYTVSAVIEVSGEPVAERTLRPRCTLTVKTTPQTWLANAGAGVPLGTCTLTFSEVVAFPQQGNTVTYCILRGKVSGRLEPDPSKTTPDPPGPITLNLDFDVAPAGDDPEQQLARCTPAMN